MRIGVVSAHYPPNFVSGGTLVPQRLARGLHARGHDVAVFAGYLDDARPALESWDETDPTGLPVRWVVSTPWIGWDDKHNYRNHEMAAPYTQWLVDTRPEVVHFHSLQSLGAGIVDLTIARGIPVLVTMHDFWWWCARQFLVTREWSPCCLVVEAGCCGCQVDRAWLNQRDAYLRGVLARVDLVLAVSAIEARVAEANGVDPARLAIDENGVPEVADPSQSLTRRGPAIPGDRLWPLSITYAGGDSEMKGAHVVAGAARLLGPTSGSPGSGGWRLTAYDCKKWFGADSADLPVETPAAFDPSELDAVLAETDVLVIASVMRESFSILCREALARGVPVITSDCLGPEEVVVDGVNGLVVPTGDASSLAQALRRLIEDRALLATLRMGCQSVPMRTVADQIDGLEQHYRRLIDGAATADPGGSGVKIAASRAAFGGRSGPGRRIDRVLFVAGIDGAPLRYRTRLPAEGLRQHNIHVDVRNYRHPDINGLGERADAVVVYRVPGTVQMAHFISGVRRNGTPVIFDVDDLIFDPDLQAEIPAISILPPAEAALWLQGVRRYRSTMELCDAFIGSTAMLCRHATEVTGLPAYQWANGTGLLLARQSDKALSRPRRPGPLRIGYLSGTNTHERDWAFVEPAMATVLEHRPDAELWLGGLVEPSDRLNRYRSRIKRLPFVSWTRLPGLLRDLDINLAPLEPDMRFNEAKSAIKWLEAALVGVPTVASPTEPFVQAIEHGVNGLLADDLDEWVERVGSLVDDPAMRARIATRARRDALLDYAPAVQGRRYRDILMKVEQREPTPSKWKPLLHDEPPQPYGLEAYELPRDPDDLVEPMEIRGLAARSANLRAGVAGGVERARRVVGRPDRGAPERVTSEGVSDD